MRAAAGAGSRRPPRPLVEHGLQPANVGQIAGEGIAHVRHPEQSGVEAGVVDSLLKPADPVDLNGS